MGRNRNDEAPQAPPEEPKEQSKEHPATSALVDPALPVKTADQLVKYLTESGTSPSRLATVAGWVKDNPGATADHLYRHMEQTVLFHGTLRKAGKWIFGAEFEPESVVKQAPAEELLRLRGENDQLQAKVKELQAANLGLMSANRYLKDQVDDLSKKIAYLSIGKTKTELETVGIG